MANDLNQCNFIGRVGQDPEVRYSANGTSIANFSIAVGHKYQEVEQTEWVKVVTFGKLADVIGQYVNKGKQVFVSGRMQTNKWEDKEGNTRYTTEIIAQTVQFLGSRDENLESPWKPERNQTVASIDDGGDIPF